MDCGDYANEDMEREISELLAAVKACLENNKATAGSRTMGEAVVGTDLTEPSCGPELLEGIWGRFS